MNKISIILLILSIIFIASLSHKLYEAYQNIEMLIDYSNTLESVIEKNHFKLTNSAERIDLKTYSIAGGGFLYVIELEFEKVFLDETEALNYLEKAGGLK